MKIYDISQKVFESKVYLGDPKPSYNIIKDMKSGDLYNLSEFSMCVHNGTHVDAPLHFIKNGKSIDEIPLSSFVGDCFVARFEGEIEENEALMILNKAKLLQADKRILIAGKAVIKASAARVFAENDILLIGNESQSVGPLNAPMEVHLILLNKDIVLLEGINLDGVKEGKYLLNAAPLNLYPLEGAPVRAILIESE